MFSQLILNWCNPYHFMNVFVSNFISLNLTIHSPQHSHFIYTYFIYILFLSNPTHFVLYRIIVTIVVFTTSTHQEAGSILTPWSLYHSDCNTSQQLTAIPCDCRGLKPRIACLTWKSRREEWQVSNTGWLPSIGLP